MNICTNNRRIRIAIVLATLFQAILCDLNAQYAGPSVSLSSTGSAPASALKLEPSNVAIVPGDIISIVTSGVPELTTSSTVSPSSPYSPGQSAVTGVKVGSMGNIQLPYLGEVKVSGLTTEQVAAKLAGLLKDGGYLVNPQISVQLVDSPTRVITVIGEVQKPTLVPAFAPLKLLDVISACGGFTPLASHLISVRRAGLSGPLVVELGNDPKDTDRTNIPLQAGDTVIVPKVGNVYVLGEVKSPQSIPLTGNTPVTVLRALAMAGGMKYAARSKALIIHTSSEGLRVAVEIDVHKMMKGRVSDYTLASDDVLLVPTNSFKAALAGGGAAVAASSLYGVAYIAK